MIRCPTDEGDYLLTNRSRTLIRFSERVSPDIVQLMTEMEELNVPFGYADRVKEIYFTYLRQEDMGDHSDGKIRISFSGQSRQALARILVHELAHNLDDHDGISERDDVIAEKRKRARYLPDSYARKNVVEYVAVSFETYYCGTPADRRRLKRMNPVIFANIRRIHRRHRAR